LPARIRRPEKEIMPNLLPSRFKDLERFIDWSIPTSGGRTAKRVASQIEEVRIFYDAILPDAEDILDYLNQFPLKEMPEDASRLMNMMLSLAEIATCIEFYNSTDVPKGVSHSRFPLVAPSSLLKP